MKLRRASVKEQLDQEENENDLILFIFKEKLIIIKEKKNNERIL